MNPALEIVRDLCPEAVARHEQAQALINVALEDATLPEHERARLLARRASANAALEALAAAVTAESPVR